MINLNSNICAETSFVYIYYKSLLTKRREKEREKRK